RYVLAALEREARVADEEPVAGHEVEPLRLDDGAAAPRGLQELEAEAPGAAREERELVGGAGAVALEPGDVSQLRLCLLRLRLLVPEPLHEAAQAHDVLLVALDRLARVERARRLLLAPGMPGAGEEGRSAGRELEPRLRLRVAAKRGGAVVSLGHRRLEPAELLLDPDEVGGAREDVLPERELAFERRPLVVERDARPLLERELAALELRLA